MMNSSILEVSNSQRLLFNNSFAPEFSVAQQEIPESFYEKGYALMEEVINPDHAFAVLELLVSNLQEERLPSIAHFLPRLRLAKIDQIPVCKPVVHCTFQALHFDMGHPLIEKLPQTLFGITALYFPHGKQAGTAKTRVVSLEKMLHQKKWGDRKMVEEKLLAYVEQYGDGWENMNTGRLACFARIIDAMVGNEELLKFRDQRTDEWFFVGNDPTGEKSRQLEVDFYARHGYDLNSVEELFQIQPGQMLIIDNFRAVHGKMGKRQEGEIYQFMYGIEHATEEDISLYRQYLVEQLGTVSRS